MKKVLGFGIFLFSLMRLWAQAYYSNTPPPSFNYDPFAETFSTGSISARLTTANNTTDLYYFWTILQAPGSRFLTNGSYSIPVSFYKSGITPLEEIKTGAGAGLSYTDVLWGYFPKTTTGTNSHSYDIIPSQGSIVPANTYTGTFTFRFYRGKPGANRTLRTSTNITMTMVVPARGDISIVNTSGIFNFVSTNLDLDFTDAVSGRILSNTTKTFDVVIKSNRNYNLSVSTTSQSYLIHQTKEGEKIPYIFTFDGTTYPLNTVSTTLKLNQGWTSTGEARFGCTIKTGLFDDFDVEPGLYRDTLTFTLSVL